MQPDTSSRDTLLTAIKMVHGKQAQQGADILQAMITRGEAAPDAFFLLGCLLCLTGKNEEGVKFIKHSHSTGKHSDNFFFLLSQLLTPFGDAGERLRLQIQQRRLIPLQQAGMLSPATTTKANLGLVEPWYFSRKMTNFFPPKQSLFEGDHNRLVKDYVLEGWLPPAPRFTRGSKVLTMGSCFAEELRNYLRENDLWSDVLFMPPGLNNTFAIRNFIEWCVTGVASNDAYWYEETDAGQAMKWSPDEENHRYREIFRSIDGIVLTIGLAEVWEDTRTGGIFWRGVPKSIFDEDVHICRLSTVSENSANLQKIVELIRSINPKAEIILTLSPVPLKATNQKFSCISADSISKSTLRIAIHNLIEMNISGVNYWPSFEIVRWLGSHVDHTLFGEDGNTRHVNRVAVKMILDNFIAAYFSAEIVPQS